MSCRNQTRCTPCPQTFSLPTFVRRFLQHVLPRSFTKIRHYGFLANHVRSRLVPLARAAIAQRPRRRRLRVSPPKEPDPPAPRCRRCGQGERVCVAYVTTAGREIRFRASPVLPQQQASP